MTARARTSAEVPEYLSHLRFRGYAASTADRHRKAIARVEAHLGHPLLEVTREELLAWQDARVDQVTLRVRLTELSVVQSFTAWALERGHLAVDPAAHMPRPASARAPKVDPSDAELIAEYFTFMRAIGRGEAVIRTYQRYLTGLAQTLPDGLLSATRRDLISFLAAHPHWKPETRKGAVTAVRAFYGWAEDEELLPDNPARKMPKMRVPAGLPRPLPEANLDIALEEAPDAKVRLMLLLGAYAGLRLHEIAKVHADDLTQEGLRVVGKGGRVRLVPLHPLLVDALAGLDGWAFPSPARPGQPVGVDYVQKRVRPLLGGPWTTHTLRHRMASRAYAQTRDLRAVQTLLGHSKPETTARYTLVPDGALREAIASL